MKTIARVITLLCLAALLLSACGVLVPLSTPTMENTPTIDMMATVAIVRATASAAATQTSTPTPTRPAATATLIPTVIPTPSYVLEAPALPISAYRLRDWSEADYASAGMPLAEIASDMEWAYYSFGADPLSILRSERLLRFPAGSDSIETAWAVFLSNPGIYTPLPGTRPGQDTFSLLVEDMLNNQDVPLERLETELEEHNIYLDDSTPVSNLTGDGQDGMTLSLTLYFAYEAVYAVHTVGDRYLVDMILPWAEDGAGYSRVYSLGTTSDLNGNNLPEILIKEGVGYSGMDTACSGDLYIAEWHRETQSFQTDVLSPWGLYGPVGECRLDWEISDPGTDGIRTISIRHYLFTQSDETWAYPENAENCPDLAIELSYRWNGTYYVLVSESLISPDSDSPACRLAWANTAIESMPFAWEDDQVTAIVAELLAAWPEELNATWGPASQDYFRLRLGIWQDLRGEGAQATATLNDLVNYPANTEYGFAPQLASFYLAERSQRGTVPACRAVSTAISDALDTLLGDDLIVYRDTDLIAESWGFADPMWRYLFRQVDFCPQNDAIRSAAHRLHLTNGSEISSWAAQNGLTWLQTIPIDLNGDGSQDWLAWLRGGQRPYLWAFFRGPDGTNAQLVTSAEPTDNGSAPDSSVVSFRPIPGEANILATRIDRSLRLFSITDLNQVEQMFSYYERGNYHSYGDYEITSLQFDESAAELRYSTSKRCEGEQNHGYRWDDNTHQLVRYDSEIDFEAAQWEVDRLIFQEQDFQAAISYLEPILDQTPEEPVYVVDSHSENCDYYPAWYIPSFRYLLALSYEMNGQPDQAAVTYYELWRDYPDNAFGILAQLKLEPIEP